MPRKSAYKIVMSTMSRSELAQFATWFHQDWKLLFPDFDRGAEMYFSTLPPARKEQLAKELAAFLDSRRTSAALKRSWLQAGAQGWQNGPDIRKTLERFVEELRSQARPDRRKG